MIIPAEVLRDGHPKIFRSVCCFELPDHEGYAGCSVVVLTLLYGAPGIFLG